MKERYQKVLSWKLEEYLHSDVAIPKQKADLEGKPPPFFELFVWGVKNVKIMVPSLNPCPLVKMSTKFPL
jgi:hypothetical protein